MYRLLLSILCLFFMLFSCKKTQDTTNENGDSKNHEIVEKDISKIDYIEFLLDEKTEKLTSEWLEYNQLKEVITNLKKADLSFFVENREVIKTTLKDFKQKIPGPLSSSSIIARINVFETKFLKLESLSNLTTTSKEELLSVIKETLVAFSNLNLQMNKKVEFDNQKIEKP